jgi:hypothetical protein
MSSWPSAICEPSEAEASAEMAGPSPMLQTPLDWRRRRIKLGSRIVLRWVLGRRLGRGATSYIDCDIFTTFWLCLSHPVDKGRAGVIATYRAVLLGVQPVPWMLVGESIVVSIVLLVSGAFYLRRAERLFADVV